MTTVLKLGFSGTQEGKDKLLKVGKKEGGHEMAASLKLGFTGTQNGMTVKQIRCVAQAAVCHCLVEYLPVEVHHGDCVGADKQFNSLARALWFRVFIHPPDDDSRRAFCKAPPERISEPKPFLMRNKDIVDQTTILIAAPKAMEEEIRSGTWATVRYARKHGRPIYICWPDGKLTFENTPTMMQQRWGDKGKQIKPTSNPKETYCSECGEPLLDTLSGLACTNGHSGPGEIDAETAKARRVQWRAKLEAEVSLRKTIPRYRSRDSLL